ncbi:hypothetical protein ACHAPJ_011728 [Fusarium lateritium]
MWYFLNWLYNKGVRHIIKLSVEDSGVAGQKGHSDQVIQESLERFIIDHLDWQKTDLDPEAILHVGSKASRDHVSVSEDLEQVKPIPNRDLRKLTLRWSGSNAVLRAWSDMEALPLLPRLEEVEIVKPALNNAYDSTEWIEAKLEDFRSRLNTSRESFRSKSSPNLITEEFADHSTLFGNVRITCVDSSTNDDSKVATGDTVRTTASTSGKNINSHKWLDSTARFSSVMHQSWKQTVQEFKESSQKQPTGEEIEKEVIVALIDDGVDMLDTALSDQILDGKTFDFHDERVGHAFASAKGHGTVMANMILRVCPMAKIYPIRLKTLANPNGKHNIDARSAAKAIQAAISKKVTIISMSWTIAMTRDQNDAEK